MNQPLANIQVPNAPTLGNTAKYHGLSQAIARLYEWARDLTNSLNTIFGNIQDQINSQVQCFGDALDSTTGTLMLTNPNHHVTGAGAITDIIAPSEFSGPVMLIPDGAFTLATGGNIALAAQAVVNRAMTVVYDPVAELWYPSYT